MDAQQIRQLDGPQLAALARTLGLDPRTPSVGPPQVRLRLRPDLWQPHENLAQADACFRGLRARGYSTGCLWHGDDRQYGDAWVATDGMRSWSVTWPREAPTEAMALTLVSVLAVASQQETLSSEAAARGEDVPSY